jgi:tripartite ATP-independent transporter DctM subunit
MAMGLISLPMMLRRGYSPALSSGVIAASGTLAQIIPPSLVLIILADTLSVPVGDMYSGALVPSMMLVGMYLSFLVGVILLRPQLLPAGEAIPWDRALLWRAATQLLPPLALIFLVLGTIFMGLATPTEGSAMGAAGAILLATIRRRLSWSLLFQSLDKTVRLTSFVMMILIGSTVFALVFRALEGDIWVKGLFSHLPGGQISFLLVVNLLVFALGCFIDFFEIVFIVVPLLLPVALAMDIDPVWFGVMLAMNMQTSFLTPPFGFSLFYLRSVAPVALATLSIYRGVIPFIVLQLIMVAVVWEFPHLVSHPPDEHVMFEIDTGALDAAGGGNTHSDDQAIRLMEDIARELRQAESREVPQ